MFRRPAAAVALVCATALVLAGAMALFGLNYAPRETLPGFFALYFGGAALLGGALFTGRRGLSTLSPRATFALILGVALLLRLAALAAPVSLSDDVWRYLWDGELTLHADHNPYAAVPSDLVAGGFLDDGPGDPDLFAQMNSPHTHTVYPPLAMGSFAAALVLADHVGGSAQRWLRLIFLLFDVAAVAGLLWLLHRLERPALWAVLYAWHPLAVWETAAGGHTEALGMVFLALTLGLLLRGRVVVAGLTLAMAGLAKWTFLACAPVLGFFALRALGLRRALTLAITSLAAFLISYTPFAFDGLLHNHREALDLYSHTFSFNAPLFYALRWLLGYQEGVTEPVTHITSPVLNTATIVVILGLAFWQNGTPRRLLLGVALSFAAYLLFAPVFHPWYALPLLFTGALLKSPTIATVGMVIAVSYLYYHPGLSAAARPGLMASQTALVALALLYETRRHWAQWLLRWRSRAKARTVDELIPRASHLLDLGTSEGYVAEALHRQGHQVQLADIVDRNRTDLPFTLLREGQPLPFDDDTFDVVVISYVLHHSRDPDHLLREALRVGRRLVILETVYETEWDRKLTTFLDHHANTLRGMAPEPLSFDTVNGWTDRLHTAGAQVRTTRWLGRTIHRHVVIDAHRRS